MLNSKKSMKLNIAVFIEIAKICTNPDGYQLEEGERFGKWYGDSGDFNDGPAWYDVVIRAAKPCSTKTINVNKDNVNTMLENKGYDLGGKLEALAQEKELYG